MNWISPAFTPRLHVWFNMQQRPCIRFTSRPTDHKPNSNFYLKALLNFINNNWRVYIVLFSIIIFLLNFISKPHGMWVEFMQCITIRWLNIYRGWMVLRRINFYSNQNQHKSLSIIICLIDGIIAVARNLS